jgi:hypothetical protein
MVFTFNYTLNNFQVVFKTPIINKILVYSRCPLQFMLIIIIIIIIIIPHASRHVVVGIATRYKLESPGIESRWGRDFPHLSWPSPRPTQPPVQWVPGLSRVKGSRGVVLITYPRLVCRGSRKRVELYFHSPFAAYNRMKPHFTLLYHTSQKIQWIFKTKYLMLFMRIFDVYS